MSFTSIGNLVDGSLQRTGVSKQVRTLVVLEKFNDLFFDKWGDQVRGKVQAIYIRNKVLTVSCMNSVMAQEIQLHSHLFIKEINKEFGEVVERIRFLL